MGNIGSKNGDGPHVCPVEDLNATAKSKLLGNLSFFEFNRIFSGACAAFAIVVMVIFMMGHATHLSRPVEQLKILRISFVIPSFAILAFITVAFPDSRIYIHPWFDFIESLALGSFFLLLCEYVAPTDTQRDNFFSTLTVKLEKGETREGLEWFRTRWFLVFQWPILSALVAIFTDITQAAGVYCDYETKMYWAKIWLRIVGLVATTVAVLTVFKFFTQLKEQLAAHNPMLKFLAFKLIIALTFFQDIIYLILTSTHNLNPTDTLSYGDLHVGIPGMIIAIEMVVFSFFFFKAYPWTPYTKKNLRQRIITESGETGAHAPISYQGGPGGVAALVAMFSPMEILEAIVYSIKQGMKDERIRKYAGLNARDGYAPRDEYTGRTDYAGPGGYGGSGVYEAQEMPRRHSRSRQHESGRPHSSSRKHGHTRRHSSSRRHGGSGGSSRHHSSSRRHSSDRRQSFTQDQYSPLGTQHQPPMANQGPYDAYGRPTYQPYR